MANLVCLGHGGYSGANVVVFNNCFIIFFKAFVVVMNNDIIYFLNAIVAS